MSALIIEAVWSDRFALQHGQPNIDNILAAFQFIEPSNVTIVCPPESARDWASWRTLNHFPGRFQLSRPPGCASAILEGILATPPPASDVLWVVEGPALQLDIRASAPLTNLDTWLGYIPELERRGSFIGPERVLPVGVVAKPNVALCGSWDEPLGVSFGSDCPPCGVTDFGVSGFVLFGGFSRLVGDLGRFIARDQTWLKFMLQRDGQVQVVPVNFGQVV
jgi:hypothetical protein